MDCERGAGMSGESKGCERSEKVRCVREGRERGRGE